MHDPKFLISNATDVHRRMTRRGFELDLGRLRELHQARIVSLQLVESLRSSTKQLAAQIRREENPRYREAMSRDARSAKRDLQKAEATLGQSDAALRDALLAIPNLPLDEVPEGDSDEFAVEIRRSECRQGTSRAVDDHVTIGERLDILDFQRGARLAGPRFAVLKGLGARLERGLRNFMLDVARRNGYVEHSVPALVNRETMTGTGQLPKFEDDLFRTRLGARELFLVPTGEVPLTNLYAGAKISAEELPIALAAETPCFRSEAGSHGRDTRGLIRMHQFSKVELVRIVHPAAAHEAFMELVQEVEAILVQLELHHRVVELPAGDIGFAAERTIDLEVWLPSQNRFREISSVSSFGQFQSRRANIRLAGDLEDRYPVTLNGSALPLGRTIAALLEQGQNEDGTVKLPKALHPYVGASLIC